MTVKMRSLETERLLLREFSEDDLGDILLWTNDSGTTYTEVEAQEFLNFCSRQYLQWGIGPWGLLLRKTGRVIGSCSFCDIDLGRQVGEVNYYITPHYRRQGFASEALAALLEFGFGDVRLVRIEARCPPGNLASERVMQKTGMTFERMIESTNGPSDGDSSYKLYAALRNSLG